MDLFSILIAVVAGLGIGWLLFRSNQTDLSKVHVIDKETFTNNMRKGQLVDIRKKDAYEQDKIKGARNFRPGELTSKYSKLRYDQSVYLYCKNGRKSKRVAKKMSRKGYLDIYVLDGGFQNYHQ
mgnify:FL=1